MGTTPPGGPSTINGVLYQMLWALKRVGSLAISESRLLDRYSLDYDGARLDFGTPATFHLDGFLLLG